jgi:hypothetical protein
LAASERREGYIGNPLSSNFYGSLMHPEATLIHGTAQLKFPSEERDEMRHERFGKQGGTNQ